MNEAELIKMIRQFDRQKVAVIGDLILDEYIWGKVERISPEAPVPVVKVEEVNCRLGGAANVAHNIAALGGQARLVGVVGDDKNAERILAALARNGISRDFLAVESGRTTTIKTRVVAMNHQIVRFDQEDTKDIIKATENNLKKILEKALKGVNVVAIADYAKGLITDSLAKWILSYCASHSIKAVADPTPSTFYKYRNCYAIKPNKKEAAEITGRAYGADYQNLKLIGEELKKKFKSNIIVTLGEDGMVVFEGERYAKLAAHPSEVFDVSGAGDTALAGIALSLSAGASLVRAASVGNMASSVVVAKLGTSACGQAELVAKAKEYEKSSFLG